MKYPQLFKFTSKIKKICMNIIYNSHTHTHTKEKHIHVLHFWTFKKLICVQYENNSFTFRDSVVEL